MRKVLNMSRARRQGARRSLDGAVILGAAIVFGALAAAPARAQSPDAAPPSESLAVNLIELLVKQGVISRTAADQLLKQAEVETEQARAASAATTVVAAGQAEPALPPPAPGVVRVPYVPEIVRDQIRDEVKAEVMQQAKDEGWAQPGELPDWLNRITISGDVRMRSQYNLYSDTNATGLIDYAAFNASGPTDISTVASNGFAVPYLNTTKDDFNNLYIRARLAVDAKLSDRLGAGIRLATGDSNGPNSTSSFLSNDFGKNAIWLDRAFLWVQPTDWAKITMGRMADPFLHTDMLFSDDLNFDGISGRFTYDMPQRNLILSLTGGAYPLGFQALSFPANSDIKSAQESHWLYAAQAGVEWNASRFDWKSAVAYYDFDNIQGELSSPCYIYLGAKQCSSDGSIPAFMQKGNTLFLVRNIVADPSNPDYAQPQLVGLAFPFELLNFYTQFDYRVNESKHLIFTADYVHNMGYNVSDICRFAPLGLPVNNVNSSAQGNADPCDKPPSGDAKATFQSGPSAWLVNLLYGDPDPTEFGQWNVTAGYRYIEPDALPDGFNSADFHFGGTNAKGYTLTTTIGLYNGAYLQARWFSADQVFGPPLAIDVGQLDLHVRF